jgi:hypothetical protein
MIRKLTPICCVTAALMTGCGGHAAHRVLPPKPKLPRALAAQLASLSDTVAQQLDAGDMCGAQKTAQQLQAQAQAASASGQIPTSLWQPLTSATTKLQSQIVCVKPPPPKHGEHGKGKHKDHGGEGN